MRISSEKESEIKKFVEELQADKQTQYTVAHAVEFKFSLMWEQAYYRTRKYWNPPTQGKKPKASES